MTEREWREPRPEVLAMEVIGEAGQENPFDCLSEEVCVVCVCDDVCAREANEGRGNIG